ncbi:MAG: TIGR03936 family radical SAM-associated protein [Synergistaceae bacterium]|nr:TIGR03936 family radical SAM-associated protein [Synergistaceae bacterium]
MFYEKRRGACFVPHVALATVFARAAARAGIGLHRTEGFSPHPRMSFGPELPAGVVALSEPLDVWLKGDFRESLASEWDARMPDGFRVKACVPLPENAPALGKLCKAAHYRVRVERSEGVGNFLRLLEGHYGEDLLNASADGPWISFVVGKPAQNGIGGWVRALVAEGAAAGWQDLRIVRLSLGRWDGVRMKSLAEEDVTCLQTKTRAASPTER